ncbi:LysR family transcriptional regulator [Oceanibium sediminis]|uniref:LysR family transcriptional regulator n=1 Tax=Oceanibium sediminis TaxID=2026339 RepID=UPI000DD2CB09|nr:LysR family transcriptional regulator [Oceanibium sediminis]
MAHLNSDHLRTFLAILEAGSITGGAERIGRSQSAASLQIRQMEDVVGQPLFRRHGRGISLTLAGEKLRPVARNVVQSLDTTLSELRGGGLKGKLRIGIPDDHSRSELANIISSFAAMHPEVELEVHCALGAGFAAALESGRLDLAVHEVPEPGKDDMVLKKDHLVWMYRLESAVAESEVLPVAVFDRDCWWRDLAMSGLDDIGRAYQVVFTSESTTGVRAAVQAGIAAGLLSASEDVEGLRPLANIKSRYPTYLVLQKASGANGPICDAMSEAILKAFAT